MWFLVNGDTLRQGGNQFRVEVSYLHLPRPSSWTVASPDFLGRLLEVTMQLDCGEENVRGSWACLRKLDVQDVHFTNDRTQTVGMSR